MSSAVTAAAFAETVATNSRRLTVNRSWAVAVAVAFAARLSSSSPSSEVDEEEEDAVVPTLESSSPEPVSRDRDRDRIADSLSTVIITGITGILDFRKYPSLTIIFNIKFCSLLVVCT